MNYQNIDYTEAFCLIFEQVDKTGLLDMSAENAYIGDARTHRELRRIFDALDINDDNDLAEAVYNHDITPAKAVIDFRYPKLVKLFFKIGDSDGYVLTCNYIKNQ